MTTERLSQVIQIGSKKFISRAQLLSFLKTYNCFLKDHINQHLTLHETGSEVMLDGLLVISWGVRRPIHLKIQDDDKQAQAVTPADPISPIGVKRGMTRWGEFDDLHHIDEMEETRQEIPETHHGDDTVSPGPTVYDSSTLRLPRTKPDLEEASNLFRCMSDASLVKKRIKNRTTGRHRAQEHRFSINGHFYNYETSIFTPSFGTPTNVRITSKMTTQEVIAQLLKKFKVENDSEEFALYCIHRTGEKKKLNDSDFPLWERLLHGPSQNIMKMFLMDSDEQEVSNDVAQYLNLDLPFLEGVLCRLEDEEKREIERIVTKYKQQKTLLSQCLKSKTTPKIETTV